MSSRSRTKAFMNSVFVTGLYQVVVMLTGFITPRVILQYYGNEINGLASSITQCMTYFNLVEAGLAAASIFALYKPLAEDNYKAVSGILSATKKFYYQAGYLFTALVLGLAVVYPILVKTKYLSPPMVALLIIFLGAKGFMEFFTMAKYRALLTADQRVYIVSFASIVYLIINTALIVLMAVLQAPVVLVYGVAIFALLARSIILWGYVHKNYPKVNYRARPNTKALNKRWDALFLQIVQAAQNGAPQIIATAVSLVQASVYNVYNMVMVGVNGILGIFTNSLSASFGDVIARGERKTLKKTYIQFEFAYLQLIAVVYSCVMVLLLPFVKLYTAGVEQASVYDVPLFAFLMALNGLLYNMKTPQGMLVISAGHYRETRYRSLAQALILIGAALLLTKPLGLNGIVLGACLSNLYRDIDLLFYVPKHITRTRMRSSIYNYILMWITFSLCSIPPLLLFDVRADTWGSWVGTALLLMLYAVAAAAVVSLIGHRRITKDLLQRVKGMVRRN